MTTSYSRICKWCGDEIIDYGRPDDPAWIHSSHDTIWCQDGEHIGKPEEDT